MASMSMRTPNTVGLVACCGPKLKHPARAKDLYTSDLFRKSVAYLEHLGVSSWAILSAKHGLVMPGAVIRPYDLSLASLPALERARWASRTGNQIMARYPAGTHFVVLGGKHYLAAVPTGCGYTWENPLKGMGIGQRKSFLKEAVQ
jgi:hypothetical protein